MDNQHEVETWSWGDIFEIEVPARWAVAYMKDAVEIRPPVGPLVAHLAPVELHGRQEGGPGDLLRSFARGRGWTGPLDVRVRLDRGLAHTSARFRGEGGHWVVHVVAWERHLVMGTARAPEPWSPRLALADAMFETLRPSVVLTPARELLTPDAPGDF